jgi:glucokinase
MQTLLLGGDIGGTKTLLALAEPGGAPRFERRYTSLEFPVFDTLLAAFLEEARAAGFDAPIQAAAFGVAGPVAGNRAQLTYLPWLMDGEEIARRFDIGRVSLVNDFAAAASGIASLSPEQVVTLQAGAPLPGAPRVALGAGTGLGVAFLTMQGEIWRVLPGEGGHMGFAPTDEEQAALWNELRAELGRVTAETVVSGPGLARIYRHVCRTAGQPAADEQKEPAAISAAALAGNDPLAARSVDIFLSCYGAFAGDLALAVLARGGVYICGGVAPKLLPLFQASGFLNAFNTKGCHAKLAATMPVHLVTEERLGLLGALRICLDPEDSRS